MRLVHLAYLVLFAWTSRSARAAARERRTVMKRRKKSHAEALAA